MFIRSCMDVCAVCEKECEYYEEEVQPCRKTDYKPIIYKTLISVIMMIVNSIHTGTM